MGKVTLMRSQNGKMYEIYETGYNDFNFKLKSFRDYYKALDFATREASNKGYEFINRCKEDEYMQVEIDTSLTPNQRLYKAIYGDKKPKEEL